MVLGINKYTGKGLHGCVWLVAGILFIIIVVIIVAVVIMLLWEPV